MRLTIEAHPNAKMGRLELVDNTLRVWVQARAIDGEANEAIRQTIARALGLRNRQVQIVNGARSRHKIFEVDITTFEELRLRLAQNDGA